jgi:hypothetical protein
MRRLSIALAAGLAVTGAGGCGGKSPGPVEVTPELERKLKEEQQKADEEEMEMYKQVGGAAPKKKPR